MKWYKSTTKPAITDLLVSAISLNNLVPFDAFVFEGSIEGGTNKNEMSEHMLKSGFLEKCPKGIITLWLSSVKRL